MRYEFDPYNRLLVNSSGKKSRISKARIVMDGRFTVDKNNTLYYNVKSPILIPEDSSRDLSSAGPCAPAAPYQFKLKGEWALTDTHNLCLVLDKSCREIFGDKIVLQGEVLDVRGDSLLFSMTTISGEDTLSTYVLNLSGSWKADKYNRLSFHLKKENGAYDILTFTGEWCIGDHNSIIYQYEKARLIRKKREVHKLIFRGRWDIKDKLRISYALDRATESSFNFNVLGGIFKEQYIKYELGVGISGRKNLRKKMIKLSGRWNLKRGLGLVFEVRYDDGRLGQIVFGADARITDKDVISFSLKKDGRDLGAELELSRRFFKGDGELFVRMLSVKEELAIYAGGAWRW